MPSFITYESFGAVGDGQIDDLPAIVKARQEANRLHLPVKAKAGATYYLSPKGLNAIGNGSFLIEETEAHGDAFVNLREDYGCNDGTHDFGYACYLPEVVIDGLTVVEDTQDDAPLFVFNDYLGEEASVGVERPWMPITPRQVEVRGIRSQRPIQLCERPELMPETVFVTEPTQAE